MNRNAGAHGVIVANRLFSVNLLASRDAETVAIFSAQRGLQGEARFRAGAWSSGRLGLPLLVDAIASFECRLVDSHEHGSHTVLIGAVADPTSCEARRSRSFSWSP